jgi:hypothetical protein
MLVSSPIPKKTLVNFDHSLTLMSVDVPSCVPAFIVGEIRTYNIMLLLAKSHVRQMKSTNCW